MIDTKTLVDDALLRELSAETRKIGSRVLVKSSNDHPEYQAEIMDVIIMPHSEFYRAKFMIYYKLYAANAVKALKELANNFPFTPDYQIGIAYVLNTEARKENSGDFNPLKIKSELEIFTSTFNQEKISLVKRESSL